jgi:7-cyano-7-deazaguanine synthase
MVILASGGMDSTTLIAYALSQGKTVRALGVLYGQRHAKELVAARTVCGMLGVQYEEVDLRDLRRLWSGSSQTDDNVPVPHGHYAAENMKVTVVPNRNLTMMCAAAGYSITVDEYPEVGLAAHAGDHAVYPDCRPEFIEAARLVLRLVDYKPVEIYAPFICMTKAEIAKLGSELGVPLGTTWSCYEGQEKHCGLCGTCVERREAFQLAGVDDPTEYA